MGAVKVTYSNKYYAKMKRIQRLPRMMGDIISGGTKRDLIDLKRIFHSGIKNNTLGLDALAEATVMGKIRKGYKRALSPLYGAGDQERDRSYSNMMRITKVGNGWKLSPNNRLHHSRKIKLKDLFQIHEHGAIIRRKTKNGEVMIRIPPRPALMIAYRQWLVIRRRKEPLKAVEVRRAIATFIEEGKMNEILNLSNWITRE